jgi:hypothetical protein
LPLTADPASSGPVAEPASYFNRNVGFAGGKNKDFRLRYEPPAAIRERRQALGNAGFAASIRRN